MDTKTLLAFALMILIYMFFFQPKPGVVHQPVASNAVEVKNDSSLPQKIGNPSTILSSGVDSVLRAKVFTLKNEKISLVVNGLGEIQSAEFLKFKTADRKSNEVFGFKDQSLQKSNLRIAESAPSFDFVSNDDRHLKLRSRTPAFEVNRSIELSESGYQVVVSDEIKNLGARTLTSAYDIALSHITMRSKAAGCGAMFGPQQDIQEVVYLIDGKANRTPLAKIAEGTPLEKVDVISWGGVSHKYFFFGLVPESSSIKSMKVSNSSLNTTDLKTSAEMSLNEKQIAPQEASTYKYSFYIGPKEMSELSIVHPELQKAIDYGDWIGPIARFLLNILHLFYSIIPNYGVAIILLTILVKMALYPLAKKSAVSMRRLQTIQPKMKDLREKYKNDKQRLNVETMKLYKEEKVNPVGGCFPLLIQMPVFFALYRVFYASIELRQAPFFGWIKDLAVHDPYFVTPVLMTALMWYQQKMTPQPPVDDDNEAAKMQRSMMKWMPIVFGAVMIFLPAGLTLYFLVSSLITILQTAYLNKKLNAQVAPIGI